MLGVAFVVHQGVAVVDLEEALSLERDQVLRRDRPAEIGVVDMREHRLAGRAPLSQHGVHVVLQDVEHAHPPLRRNQRHEIRRIDVNGRGLEPVRDFLALEDQKASLLLEQNAVFLEGLEPDGGRFPARDELHPTRVEPRRVAVERCSLVGVDDTDPPLALRQHVVVRERDEVVVSGPVP